MAAVAAMVTSSGASTSLSPSTVENASTTTFAARESCAKFASASGDTLPG